MPWKMVWTVSPLAGEEGARSGRHPNLTQREQTEFWNLLKKMKGHPGNLTKRDRTRIKHIVGKAIRG